MHVVEFEDVSKSFGGKRVVENISFSVEKGEIFGLLGPNGAGKTTLIRLLLDILKPDEGTVRVFGDSLGPVARDRVGYLPEERGLYRKIKLVDMLVYLAELKNVPKKKGRERAEELLRSLGLYEHRDKRVGELSKGMQQKIQFLSAVIHDPDLIILDEPFSGLDPVSARVIRDSILERKKAGKTIILSTHMMERAQALCDRILMVNRGRRVLYGTVAGVRQMHGKNSLLVEFETGNSFPVSSSSSPSTPPSPSSPSYSAIRQIREIPGIRRLVEREGAVEIFPEEGVSTQFLLTELVGKVELRRFEQLVPSLDEVFIETVEGEE
ncbi:MAG: ATP-binding cassette domain-containing protein [Methanosarcinaceae archaeon]|nr:ATP-binding cassette domain-containing protein [Methanosarcinaceae archaeon]